MARVHWPRVRLEDFMGDPMAVWGELLDEVFAATREPAHAAEPEGESSTLEV